MTSTSNPESQIAAHVRAALEWYRDAGVDEVTSDAPLDWSAFSSSPVRYQRASSTDAPPYARAPSPPRQPAPMQPTLASAPSDAVIEAKSLASKAKTLADLERALEEFEGCRLKMTATNLCFYRGSETARTMVIGEAPGADEDRAGKPFVGKAGQLFTKMLAAIGLSDADVHITNTVYWRPPGNRTPSPQETQICWPFLERQIALVDPDVLLLLGGAATKTILATPNGIMKMRGKWQALDLAGRERQILPTLHPAYLLRTPAAKRLAWRDFLMLQQALEE